MKTIQRQVEIPTQKIERDIYIACDGREFYDSVQCRNYEYGIMMHKIKMISSDSLSPFIQVFYFIDSDETLEFLVGAEFGGKNKTVNGNKICVGDWVTCRYQYNPNDADDYDLLTLDELKNGILELAEEKYNG